MDGYSLVGKEFDFLHMLDLAASTKRASFDIVEIPDYLAFGAFLPAAIRHLGGHIGKVVLSMHGTLSDALEKNWAPALDEEALDLLKLTESLSYRSADIRYAISTRYRDQWQKEIPLPALQLDLRDVFKLSTFQSARGKSDAIPTLQDSSPPSLVFLGRQEKWKGPDLFIDLVAGLAKEVYSELLFVGPTVSIGGLDSWQEIEVMARRRAMTIHRQSFTRPELLAKLPSARWVVIIPSRHDTFNLAALEALLSGVPTMISQQAGVCEYLTAAFPGLPYVQFDPEDLTKARRQLGDLVANYDHERGRLLAYLKTANPQKSGTQLATIYDQVPQFDPEARAKLESVFDYLATHIQAALAHGMRKEITQDLRKRIGEMFDGNNPAIGEHVVTMLGHVTQFGALAEDAREIAARQSFLYDDQMTLLQDKLSPNCFSGNRVPVYLLMAELELQRGNDLLYATYQLRCMRLTNRAAPGALDRVCEILNTHGFKEEAQTARFLFGETFDFEGAFNYLEGMRTRFMKAPTGNIETTKDFRTIRSPKISIIVSLYNAAAKLPTFLRGIRALTQSSRSMLELVLIDSFSPDNTLDVVTRCLRELKADGITISTVYMRTSVRETIQRAWNRGIDLARGQYLSFLGVDEMNRADAFDIMAKYLDDNPAVDWVQGSALITETNMAGSFVRDVMLYDRQFEDDFMNLFDTCYLGYVGALYRKNIHERVGYYDDRFKAAGDSEFKNRALPYIDARTLPDCLGYFLNYPDERTTQSPTAEIEDLRAWYLHRSPAGIAYGWRNASGDDLVKLFYKTLNYRKSYMGGPLTDVELGCSAVQFLHKEKPDFYKEIFSSAAVLPAIRDIYRVLDEIGELTKGARGACLLSEAGGIIERSCFALSVLSKSFQYIGFPVTFGLTNDNRSHQHHWLWRSQSRQIVVERPAAYPDLAGPQDFAELFSSCGSADRWVDFESAWRSNTLGQVKALFDETSLDIAVLGAHLDVKTVMRDVRRIRPQPTNSITFLAHTPGEIVPFKLKRVYGLGEVRTDRPILSAVKVIVVPHDSHAPSLAVYQLLRVLGLGKAIVTQSEVVAGASKLLPDLDLTSLSAVTLESELLSDALRLSNDDVALAHRTNAVRAIGRRLRNHPRSYFPLSSGSPARDGASDDLIVVEPGRAFESNRRIRILYEEGGLQALRSDFDAVSEGNEPHRALIQALFQTKQSPILKTDQPIFKRIWNDPPIDFLAD
ncbi:MAG: glycosyltransferase [Beijerinckiaceae bacterium]|nr:glycosyltransferase [Beijerinckiaceae bacterium]